jgi:hypothetical protein
MMLTCGFYQHLFCSPTPDIVKKSRYFSLTCAAPDYSAAKIARINSIIILASNSVNLSINAYEKNKRTLDDRNGPASFSVRERISGQRANPQIQLFSEKKRGVGIFTLFFLFISLTAINAQVFNAGVSGGINISQVEGDGLAGYNKAGATFGLFVNTLLSEYLAAQFEINYSPKGSQLKTSLENPLYYRMELHYIEFPLMISYMLPAEFTAEAGLSGGYLFSAKEKDEFGEMPVSHPFRKREIAALIGFSRVLSDKISVNLRISYSIIPIREHAGGGTYYFNRGQNNNVISFTARYRF